MPRPFFDTIEAIDKITQGGIGELRSFSELAPLLTSDQLRRYFYTHLDDPAWLQILTEAGEMSEASGFEIDSETGKRLGYKGWPQMDYLKKISPTCPENVVDVLLNLDDNGNHWVYSDTVEAALKMPAGEAAKLVTRICQWLEHPDGVSFFESYGNLVVSLAEGQEIPKALQLTRSLLALRESDEKASYRDVKGRIEDWDYGEILNTIVIPLTRKAGASALELFAEVLAEGLALAETGLTRPSAIEDHEQNDLYREPLDLLVFACRDSAMSLLTRDSSRVFSILGEQSHDVFRRIEIYLFTQNPKIAPDRLEQLFADPKTYNIEFYHEIYRFLEQHFDTLSETNQNTYLSRIDAEQGPANEKDLKKKEHFRDLRRYRKLYPIKDFLKTERKSTFEELKSRFKELEHPDFVSYTSSAVFVGEEEPKGYYDLSDLSDEEIIRQHRDIDFDDAESRRDGFAAGLYHVVATDVGRLPALLHCFDPVGLRHSAAFFRHLRETIGSGSALPARIWNALLTLVTDHSDSINSGEERTDVRKAIANFLSAGLNKTNTEIPIEFREHVSKILSDLSEDPNPTIDEESQDESSYGNLAINTVRGVAIEAMMQFGLWLYRNSDKGESGGSLKWKGLSTDELLKSTLERHLDPNQDPSLTIRSVYGRMIPWLIRMDVDWVRKNLEVLFPKTNAGLKHRRASWGSYVVFCRLYPDVASLLATEYQWAATQIGTWDDDRAATFDADERLAEHLMLMYWNDMIDLDSEILRTFYSVASDQLHRTAISFVASNLKYLNTDSDEGTDQRLMALWESRIAEIEKLEAENPKCCVNEATAFGQWFASGAFKPEWSLSHLSRSLKYASPKHRDIDILRRLSALSDEFIVEVVSCLQLIVDSDAERWFSTPWIDDIRSILSKGMRADDDGVREESIALVHKLGERGLMELRKLLEE